MSDAKFVQTNFTAGELSPRLVGRSDFSKFENGCREQLNAQSQRHGGAIRRSGTHHVAAVKTSSKRTRLVRFVYSVTQTYVLEFGENYIRFYRNKGRLENGGTPTEISTTYTESELVNLKFAQSADQLYIAHPDHAPAVLSRTAGDDSLPGTWTLADAQHDNGPYLDINDTAVTLTPAATTGSNINVTASSALFAATDVGRQIRLSNPASNYDWGWATITSFTSDTVVKVTINRDFATTNATTDWQLGAWSDTTGWPAAVTFHKQRLWFAATTLEPQTLWSSNAGRFHRFQPSKFDGTVEDLHGIVWTLDDDLVNTIRWLVSDAQGLLMLTDSGPFVGRGGSSPYDPITPTSFVTVRQGADGAHATAAPQPVGEVVLVPQIGGREVRELTYRFEIDRFVEPDMTVLAQHITLTNLIETAIQQHRDHVMWATRGDGVLLGFTYEREQEVTAWHRHIMGGSLNGSDQPVVESIAVIRDGDDDLLWLITKRTINDATVRHVEYMEPLFDDDLTIEDAFMVDAGLSLDNRQTIENATNASPIVLTITGHGLSNGDVVKLRDLTGMVEVNQQTYTIANVAADTFELADTDGRGYGAYTGGGTAAKEVSSVSGLDHLEGETVTILADGGEQTPQVVFSGAITLTSSASIIHVGLPYTSRIQTMPITPQVIGFDPRGEHQRIWEITLILHNSMGGRFGYSTSETMDDIVYREVDDDVSLAPPLKSGRSRESFSMSDEEEAYVTVEQRSPLPLTVLSIIMAAQVKK